MPIDDNKRIFQKMYRTHYEDREYFFYDILKDAILNTITNDCVTAELLAQSKEIKLWNKYKKEYSSDIQNGIVPLFTIVHEKDRIVKWIGECSRFQTRREQYRCRPELYEYIDQLNDRQYEIMACVLCEFLGADKITLTEKNKEGGVDFFARIPFPEKAHFLFGVKGPVRIVGQCKKYSVKDNVGHMKEFVQTLDHVHNRSYRAGEILPDWFKLERGAILGWHISNLGHQAGALDIAKNYGILVSDSKQMIEIICRAKAIRHHKNAAACLREKYMTEERYL